MEALLNAVMVEPSDQPYRLDRPEKDNWSMGQGQLIEKLFDGVKKEGHGLFFVECGALDGETRSNTLALEKRLGWSGVLVEADPSNVRMLKVIQCDISKILDNIDYA